MSSRADTFLRRLSREIRAAFTVAAYANFGARGDAAARPGRHGEAARHGTSDPDRVIA